MNKKIFLRPGVASFTGIIKMKTQTYNHTQKKSKEPKTMY